MFNAKYFGKKQEIGGCSVYVQDEKKNITPLKHIERHSPDGFQWGYYGSGPADLALSILHDFCKRYDMNPTLAEDNYQEFKNKFIASVEGNLSIDFVTVQKFLECKPI